MLGFGVADDDKTRRNVGHTNGGIGFIDVLATRPGRPHRIDADIAHGEININIFGLWKDGHSRRAGVNTALSFGDGDALHAVDAGFEFHFAKYALAGDGCDDFFIAAHRGLRFAFDFDFPSLQTGVAGIHREEIARENCGFIAASACPNFEHDGGVIVFIFG